ncbi:hypothetical protein ALC57_17973, partial [Trachymyrmex cornetzi]
QDQIEETEDRNDPPNKENYIEYDASSEDEGQESKYNENNRSKNSRVKPTLTNIQTFKNNVIDSHDLLNEEPLHSGSQKLFERNKIPSLNPLILGEAKATKYEKYYHIALPINEGQREGPIGGFKSNHCSSKKFTKYY